MSEVTGESVGLQIAARRRELGISQEELADRAGISRNYISIVENGKGSVTLDVYISIADALDMDAAALIFGHTDDLYEGCTNKEEAIIKETASSLKKILMDHR